LETILPGRNTHTVAIINALAMATGAYIGLQIANNGVRGKYFNADLYDKENLPNRPEGGKGDGTKQADAF
jgi:hypothetical protein